MIGLLGQFYPPTNVPPASAIPPGGSLPSTGLDLIALVAAVVVALALGLLFFRLGRRRAAVG